MSTKVDADQDKLLEPEKKDNFFDLWMEEAQLAHNFEEYPEYTDKVNGKDYGLIKLYELFLERKELQSHRLSIPNILTVLLAWDMGYGKTHQVNIFFQKMVTEYQFTMVAIVHRRKLATEVAQNFGIVDYQNHTVTDRFQKSLAVCINSLLMVDTQPDILFVDEIEGICNTLASCDMFRSAKEQEETYLKLIRLMANAKVVILADANMTALVSIILKQAGLLDRVVYAKLPRKPKEYIYVGAHKAHYQMIEQEVLAGKRLVIACMSVEEGRVIERSIVDLQIPGVSVRFVHGTSPGIDAFLQDPSQEKYRYTVFIYSPVIDAGISILLKDWFDQIHLICANRADSTTSIQMIARPRFLKSINVYFSGRRSHSHMLGIISLTSVQNDYTVRERYRGHFLQKFIPEYRRPEVTSPEYLEFLQNYEFVSVSRGRGWVTEFLINNYMTIDESQKWREVVAQVKPRQDSYRNANRIEKELREQWVREGCEQEEYELLCLSKRPSKKDLAYIEHFRLKKFYGLTDLYGELGDIVIKRDQHKILTEKVRLFARIQASHYQDGLYGISKDDFQQEIQRLYLYRDNFGGKIKIYRYLLECLDIDVTADVDRQPEILFSKDSLDEVFHWASREHIFLKAFGVPTPAENRDYPITWLRALLSRIGLKFGRERQRRGENNSRYRTYPFDYRSLFLMQELSAAEFYRVLSHE